MSVQITQSGGSSAAARSQVYVCEADQPLSVHIRDKNFLAINN